MCIGSPKSNEKGGRFSFFYKRPKNPDMAFRRVFLAHWRPLYSVRQETTQNKKEGISSLPWGSVKRTHGAVIFLLEYVRRGRIPDDKPGKIAVFPMTNPEKPDDKPGKIAPVRGLILIMAPLLFPAYL